jgi:hypothetical protein
MQRFLLALALVAVAGATYVATAPGSQTAGPTAKQFKALKKEVAKLQKDETFVKALAIEEAVLLSDCMSEADPIGQFGDTNNGTYGYSYSDPTINGGTPFLTSAIDFAKPADPNALWITGGTSICGTDINPAIRKIARLAGVHLPAARHAGHAARR